MSNNATWMPREIDGTVYSFDHLKTFFTTVSRPAKPPHPELSFELAVVFDCHVSTEACDTQHEGPAYWKDSGDKCRVFDLRRYEMSQALPSIIKEMIDGQEACYEAKNNNYMVWRAANSDPKDPPYLFFFNLYKPLGTDERLVMYVQSAYEKDEAWRMRRDNKKVFLRLCCELLGIAQKKKKGPRSKSR